MVEFVCLCYFYSIATKFCTQKGLIKIQVKFEDGLYGTHSGVKTFLRNILFRYFKSIIFASWFLIFTFNLLIIHFWFTFHVNLNFMCPLFATFGKKVLDLNGLYINTSQTKIRKVCLPVISTIVICSASTVYNNLCRGLKYLLKVR